MARWVKSIRNIENTMNEIEHEDFDLMSESRSL